MDTASELNGGFGLRANHFLESAIVLEIEVRLLGSCQSASCLGNMNNLQESYQDAILRRQKISGLFRDSNPGQIAFHQVFSGRQR